MQLTMEDSLRIQLANNFAKAKELIRDADFKNASLLIVEAFEILTHLEALSSRAMNAHFECRFAWNELIGLINLEQGNTNVAKEIFQNVLRDQQKQRWHASDEHLYTHLALIRTLLVENDIDGSIDHLEETNQLLTSSLSFSNCLKSAYFSQALYCAITAFEKDFFNTEELLNDALEIHRRTYPTGDFAENFYLLKIYLAKLSIKQGELDIAQIHLQDATDAIINHHKNLSHPKMIELNLAYVELNIAKGDIDEAKKHFAASVNTANNIFGSSKVVRANLFKSGLPLETTQQLIFALDSYKHAIRNTLNARQPVSSDVASLQYEVPKQAFR